MSKKRFEPKFKIKKGDKVIVIAGNDRGKEGKVLEVLPEVSKVIVENIAMATKHMKPSAKNPDGGIEKIPMPISISNVSLIDPKSGKPTRVGIKREGEKVERIAKKSGGVI